MAIAVSSRPFLIKEKFTQLVALQIQYVPCGQYQPIKCQRFEPRVWPRTPEEIAD
jgi:hypothetical protein